MPRLLGVGLAALLGGCSDIPQVAVEVVGTAITSEAGGSVNISLSLAQRPRGVVTIEAMSDDTSEGTVSSAVSFDPSDWRTPRIITITGVDDGEDDGDVAYAIRLLAASARTPEEEPLEVGRVIFLNRDDEVSAFAGLGDLQGGLSGSYVFDMTPSGDVIVGDSEGPSGRQATRWTGGQVLAIANEVSHAEGVSPDGRYIAGSIPRDPFSGGFWRGVGPFVSVYQANTEPLAPIGAWMVLGVGALDDGQVLGNCKQLGNPNPGFDCGFVPPGGFSILAGMTLAYGVDSAGNRVGTRLPNRYEGSAFGSLAYFNDRQLPFPTGTCMIPHTCEAAARALTTGGGVIVGDVSVTDGVSTPAGQEPLPTAFVYTPGEGMLRLPDLAGGEEASSAYAVSEDGSLIAGFGTDAEGARAVLWIDRVPISLEAALAQTGGSVPQGFQLRDVQDVSADGLIVVGNGINADGNPEGYRVVFPSRLSASAAAVAMR